MKVYKVLLPEYEPKLAFTENCLNDVMAEIEGAEIGDRIIIEIVEMSEEEFDVLPEYPG